MTSDIGEPHDHDHSGSSEGGASLSPDEGTFGADDGDGTEVYIPGDSIQFQGSALANTPLVAPQIDGLGWTFQTAGDNEMRVQARRSLDSNPALPAILGRFRGEGGGEIYGFMDVYAEDDTAGSEEGRVELGAAEAGAVKTFKPVPSMSNVYQSGTGQSVAAGSFEAVRLDNKRFDYGPTFDDANDQLSVDHAGVYDVYGQVTYGGMADGTQFQVRILVNGAEEARDVVRSGAAGQQTASVQTSLDLSAGDTISLQTYNGDSSARSLATGSALTYLSVS